MGDIYWLGQILRPVGCCFDLSLSNPGSANFFQAINSLGLRGHMSSVARRHLCCYSRKTPSITHKWVWLCSIKTWFTKKVACRPRKTSRFLNLVQEEEATRYQPSQSLQIQSKLPYPHFTFHGFSYVWSTVVWKQMNLLLTYHQKVNSSPDSTTLCLCHPLSSHHVGISSPHIVTRRIWCSEMLWESERDPIPILEFCSNSSVWLLLLLIFYLCPTYKLNFITGMGM